MSRDYAEQRANYRFLNNPKVEEQALISECTSRLKAHCKGRHLLVIQDGTEFDFTKHSGRLQPGTGLGPVRISNHTGFFLHPSLVLDAHTLTPLGFSHIELWHRDKDNGTRHSRQYHKLPIEEKESYKWISSSEASKQNLAESDAITIIQDREGDIYEQFALIPDDKTHLLVRASTNRKLASGTDKLFDHLKKLQPQATYTIAIDEDVRNNRKARQSDMEIRYEQVEIKRPGKCRSHLPKTLSLYIIEAKESEKTVPKGEAPVCWRLWTTHTIETVDQAKAIIDWYGCRWFIEQVFRLMKKKGFAIESSELETGWAIRKLAILILQGVLKICQMMVAYENEESQPITEVFEAQEIACLEKLNEKLEGNTEKTQNPYAGDRLSWATWIIARLGGWNGYRSERPPGPITFKNGLDEFNSIYKGWLLLN
ncbi:IS4 family transposase [Flavivirga sp. 57AJ16]|uniref:IS4 family transposase n=1 Tax=Flavivirga sp. 57AJ16 TaxID=3025307 RepID=UPI0023660E05|nr:IS4 family transposase [Flavivirga sp. 57AJ16]MDD7886903.1 IS4 family transposase [Flavivirga sp. 57AJ16]